MYITFRGIMASWTRTTCTAYYVQVWRHELAHPVQHFMYRYDVMNPHNLYSILCTGMTSWTRITYTVYMYRYDVMNPNNLFSIIHMYRYDVMNPHILYSILCKGMTSWTRTTCTACWWRNCWFTRPISLSLFTMYSTRYSLSMWARLGSFWARKLL